MDSNSSPGIDAFGHGGVPARRGRSALWIAGLGLILLTFAAFVLSYDGLYATALAGGVRPSLAFLYPMIFDGFLVVAFAAALVLRSAGLRATWYPWTLIVVLLLAAAGANVLHALGRESLLPPNTTKVIVATVPPVALGLAFPLWLLMFVYVRGGRRARAGERDAAFVAASGANREDSAYDIVPGLRHEEPDQPAPKPTEEPAAESVDVRQSDDRVDGRAKAGARDGAAPADTGAADYGADSAAEVDDEDESRRQAPVQPAPSPSPPSTTPPSAKVRSSPVRPDA